MEFPLVGFTLKLQLSSGTVSLSAACNLIVKLVTNAELDLLETVDLMLLRSILKAPKSTPKEMLYLELGVIPFRKIMRQRRLSYLFYIVNEDQDSIIYKFFITQKKIEIPRTGSQVYLQIGVSLE